LQVNDPVRGEVLELNDIEDQEVSLLADPETPYLLIGELGIKVPIL